MIVPSLFQFSTHSFILSILHVVLISSLVRSLSMFPVILRIVIFVVSVILCVLQVSGLVSTSHIIIDLSAVFVSPYCLENLLYLVFFCIHLHNWILWWTLDFYDLFNVVFSMSICLLKPKIRYEVWSKSKETWISRDTYSHFSFLFLMLMHSSRIYVHTFKSIACFVCL